ncbi:MAG TPA: IS1182 family transposase [Phycisphaerales bacterium]|nr:IS1182 family transposase [Phycisphaerales bacterium]
MGNVYRPYEPDQMMLLPQSLREWLPTDHLVWFVSETVDQLDLSAFHSGYRDGGTGELAYHPAMMLKLPVYSCCVGIFSSRAMSRGVQENVALRALAAGNAPGHRTICRFRERHLKDFENVFVQIVQIAREAGLVRMGTIAVDGTKIRADASKRKAMSYDRMQKEEARLREELKAIAAKAEAEDASDDERFGPDFRGDELPEELRRRESRLKTIVAAKERLEARKREEAAQRERDAQEARRAQEKQNDDRDGKGQGGADGDDQAAIAAAAAKPKPKDQENFTDPDSRIMKDGTGAFQQCYNGQVAVDSESQIVVSAWTSQSASDAKALVRSVEEATANTGVAPREVLADAGFASEANFLAMEQGGVRAYVSLRREGKPAKGAAPKAEASKRTRRRLTTQSGRKNYARRKHLVEPAIGWLKKVVGFRQFSLRGAAKVAGEFKLACMALNIRRLHPRMEWTLATA